MFAVTPDVPPQTDDGEDFDSPLRGQLADFTLNTLGAALVGYNPTLVYGAYTVGAALRKFQDGTWANQNGANLVAFVASATAIETTVQEFLTRGEVHVFDYLTDAQRADVAARTELIDVSAAVQTAIAVLVAKGGGALVFDNGFYRLDHPVTVTGSAIYFVGQGARASVLRIHHDSGIAVCVQDAISPGVNPIYGFGMRDISARALVETTGNCLVQLNKVDMFFAANVQLEDHFGGLQALGGLQHYLVNVHILSPRSSGPAAWSGPKTGSYGYDVGLSADGQLPSEFFIANLNDRRQDSVNWLDKCVSIRGVDGIWFSGGHAMGAANDAVHIEPPTGTEQITGVRFSNFWFDNNCTYGLHIVGSSTATFGEVEIYGSRFLSHLGASVFIEAGSNFEGLIAIGGTIRKAQIYGMLLRSGRNTISGFNFGACNISNTANAGAITVDNSNGYTVIAGCAFDQTEQGITATGMIGIRVNAGTAQQVIATGNRFDLTAADISDGSTSNLNVFNPNVTTKPATATSVSGTSLLLNSVGAQFYVSAGLNFANMTGREDGRVVRLIFAGTSVVTNTPGLIVLTGSTNFTSAANGSLTLRYSTQINAWREESRSVA